MSMPDEDEFTTRDALGFADAQWRRRVEWHQTLVRHNAEYLGIKDVVDVLGLHDGEPGPVIALTHCPACHDDHGRVVLDREATRFRAACCGTVGTLWRLRHLMHADPDRLDALVERDRGQAA